MKILHIISSLGMGGAENVLIGVADGQKKCGHEVTIMPLVCPKYTPVRARIEETGVDVRPFAESGSVYRVSFIWKILKELRHYDIVHVHLFPALYWAGFAKLFSCSKTPLVYTEHSTSNRRRNNRFLRIVDTIVYQYGYKMVIACADKVLETYRKAFPSVKHVCAINNGVDTQLFRNAVPYCKGELFGVDENCFLVTMVARFMTMKRQDTIVESLTKTSSNIHAVFVGGDKTDEYLLRIKAMAQDLGVEKRVHFLYIRKDVPRLLKTTDVAIMASDYEGLSLSSIEGMAAGKPFVATDVDGLREVVGGAGVLYENNNSDALAQVLDKLASDHAFYDEISLRCANRAAQFDIKNSVDSYMAVYHKVLDGQS